MAQYVFFIVAAPIVARLPRRLLSLLGAACGILAYIFARSARRSVHRNLTIARPDWPERRRRTAAVQVFIHSAWSYIELLALSRTSADAIRASYTLSGWEHVEQALAAGKGVIMISGHVGAFSAAGQVVALNGAPTTVLVERLQPPRLHNLIAGLRESFGLRMLTADRAALREVLTRLRQNEVIGLMCDRDVVGTGELLPFFGRTTRMTTAAATIARRTGAVVLPSVGYRTGVFAGVARVDPPIEIPRTSDVGDDVQAGTRHIISYLESIIRAHPEQWVVFEEIWPSGTMPGTWPVPARSEPV